MFITKENELIDQTWAKRLEVSGRNDATEHPGAQKAGWYLGTREAVDSHWGESMRPGTQRRIRCLCHNMDEATGCAWGEAPARWRGLMWLGQVAGARWRVAGVRWRRSGGIGQVAVRWHRSGGGG